MNPSGGKRSEKKNRREVPLPADMDDSGNQHPRAMSGQFLPVLSPKKEQVSKGGVSSSAPPEIRNPDRVAATFRPALAREAKVGSAVTDGREMRLCAHG